MAIRTVEAALAWRNKLDPVIEKLPDNEAVNAAELYPVWAVGKEYEADKHRVRSGEKLYKCKQSHTSQADWNPELTPALWVVIDETHTGTIEDPIPAARGMEYEYGRYYLDTEDGKTYLCEHGGEMGTVVLQYMPHELVGHYFTEV